MKYLFAISLCLTIVLSACLPTIGKQTNVNDAVGTAIAATKAVENSAATIAAATLGAGQTGGQSQPPQSVEPTATPTATKVQSTTATANININCRSGPNAVFDLVVVFYQGESGVVIGKNTVASPAWYELELTDGKQCWAAGDNLTISSDASEVPEIQSPPTPTPVPPASLWAGTWTIYYNNWSTNDPVDEQVFSATFVMTAPNIITGTYSALGCTQVNTYLTISADGYSADGTQSWNGGGCGATRELHLRMDPNKNQFRGRMNEVGNSSLDWYFAGARNGFGKPNPPR